MLTLLPASDPLPRWTAHITATPRLGVSAVTTAPDVSAAPVAGAGVAAAPTGDELAYVVHMVEHHRQALRMVAILRGRGGVPYRMSNLADHLAAIQGTEIADMTEFLAAWGRESKARGEAQPAPAHLHLPGPQPAPARSHLTSSQPAPAHSHLTGPQPAPAHLHLTGPLPDVRLRALKKTDGDAAGRMFLKLMIAHHEDAVKVSTDVLSAAENPWVISLARHIIAEQRAEIAAMRRAAGGSDVAPPASPLTYPGA
ncbi:DUF305 domain-containing protein [Actinoplanes cyaneus]|uniref:DUF305 domain-containing protein n=1 Tax=Actinoplanes cyaneus TaxID=52696 RepID=UPI0022276889|nr:DUF305 domain-containing protein [Actinoplanes cyaneus]